MGWYRALHASHATRFRDAESLTILSIYLSARLVPAGRATAYPYLLLYRLASCQRVEQQCLGARGGDQPRAVAPRSHGEHRAAKRRLKEQRLGIRRRVRLRIKLLGRAAAPAHSMRGARVTEARQRPDAERGVLGEHEQPGASRVACRCGLGRDRGDESGGRHVEIVQASAQRWLRAARSARFWWQKCKFGERRGHPPVDLASSSSEPYGRGWLCSGRTPRDNQTRVPVQKNANAKDRRGAAGRGRHGPACVGRLSPARLAAHGRARLRARAAARLCARAGRRPRRVGRGAAAMSKARPVRPASAAKAADWPRLAEARASLRHELTGYSREPAGPCLSHLAFDAGGRFEPERVVRL